MASLPAEFEVWWKNVKDLSEFRGVTEAAALALWQVAGGKMPVEKKEEGVPLPEAFQHFWKNATHLAEFRGCSMAAAYAAWLDGRNSTFEEAASEPVVSKIRAAKKLKVDDGAETVKP